MFNASTGKDWTTSQMMNYWNKLRTEHKDMFELLQGTGIEYRSSAGRIHAPDHWWETKIKLLIFEMLIAVDDDVGCVGEQPKVCEVHELQLYNSDREYGGGKYPIKAEATDSSGSPVEGRANFSINIFGNHSGDNRKLKHRKVKGKKKMYGAREVSPSLEQLEGDRLHLFALWLLRDKENRNSYCAAKTPYLRFKFIEHCFERYSLSLHRNW
ncbi:unnamed protein product [Fraxinus pennsylvanica]|uniref:Myb/SANT-like domain-containing protein n=1 Tax=Fraxinus pennsylvanica TaxID=56036 RepID=A0AAD2EEJ2_9LAMI|nr:unnamed protein product [Fraxinus pennsylvanica]